MSEYIAGGGHLRATIIGLTGYARSGKSTAADYLVREYGYELVSFAEPLKEAALALDPLVDFVTFQRLSEVVREIGWESAKDRLSEVRRTLQRLGTEVGREQFGQNFWVDRAMAKIHPGGEYVISDVRFLNEAKAVQTRGGFVARIERDGIGPNGAHSSETELDSIVADGLIYNTPSTHFHYLHRQLDETVRRANLLARPAA